MAFPDVEQKRQKRVAIVGSGMAGLVTAYLLNQDEQQRYAVTLFENGKTLSFDAASVSIPSLTSTGCFDRVDLPMRAFAGGYYQKLKDLYDHLGLQYRAQLFHFAFSQLPPYPSSFRDSTSTPYFIHSSNNHRFPPLKPSGMPTGLWLARIFYLFFSYVYFTLCCMLIRPRSESLTETLGDYLTRIRISEEFKTHYILPLISSVTTCPHAELLQFPAIDVINYKIMTHGKQHYRVVNGVGVVQEILAKGIETRFSTHVLSVSPQTSHIIKLQWRHTEDRNNLAPSIEEFDNVVMAVSPDIVGNIFATLKDKMSRIPTVRVESHVHADVIDDQGNSFMLGKTLGDSNANMGGAQSIFLRTSMSGSSERRTESIHVQPSGVLVTTCPIMPIDTNRVIQSSTFTRVLRTPESRQIVNELFQEEFHEDGEREGMGINEKLCPKWRNGDDGVWLVGGWCWDGMVLLEGCIVSAIRVAKGLGVEVPF